MLPTHYVLKRWTREACSGSILDRQGREVVENPKLEAQLRLRSLSHKFLNMAYKAAISLECCLLIDNAPDLLGPQVEDKLNAPSSVANEKPCNDQENISPNMQQRDDLLGTAQLKKKEVQLKGSKRKKSWIEKLRKGKRKATKSAVPTKKGAKVYCNLDILILMLSLTSELICCILLATTKERRWCTTTCTSGE